MITATYSPEDDKIRLYSDSRLDSETYQEVKMHGFRWAPKQDLFFAVWSPNREAFAIQLSEQEELEPEQLSLADRAEERAARFADYSAKRVQESRSLADYASKVSERFAFGQPILVGHHSERKARKDAERMDRALEKSAKAFATADYWQWRAKSLIRHANHLQSPGTRARRIKSIMADLRKYQRQINFASRARRVWAKIGGIQDEEKQRQAALYYSGAYNQDGRFSPRDTWRDLDAGRITVAEAIHQSLVYHAEENDGHAVQWISHLYNRIVYERELLGDVPRFSGEMKPAVLQTFLRELGAEKPAATRTADGWKVVTAAPLPVVLPVETSEGREIELSVDEWRDLMAAMGHAPKSTATKKGKASVPILNYRPASGTVVVQNRFHRESTTMPVVDVEKAVYAKIHKDYKGTSVVGGSEPHRVRTVMQNALPGRPGHGLVAVFLVDQKAHEEPAMEVVA